MYNDPLDAVFETPEQSLAYYLRAMPKSLQAVFQREFMRRSKELPFTDPSLPTPCTTGCMINTQVGGHHKYCDCNCHKAPTQADDAARLAGYQGGEGIV